MTSKKLSLADALATLADLQQPLHKAELKALAGLDDEELRLFVQLWPKLPGERRVAVAQALDELGEDNVDLDFRAVLSVCLADSEPGVRAAAVDGLWEDERLSTMARLLDLLHDNAGEVRAAATIGLSRFAYRAELGELSEQEATKLREKLLAAAIDPEQPLEVRRRAVEGLGYFAAMAEAQAEIGHAYAHPEQLMRESAVVAMGRSMRPTWHPYIQRELTSPSPAMRYEAARAVGELGEEGQPMLGALLPLVEDDDSEVVLAAIWALGQVGGEHAKRVLERLARSRDSARSQAARDALDELSLGEL